MARNLSKGQSIVGLLFGVLCIWYFVARPSGSENRPAATTQTQPAPGAAGPTAASPAEQPVDANPEPATLSEAIAAIRPRMTDTSETMSQGAIDLGLWAAAAPLRWNELIAQPRTKAALVFKDPDEQRGKVLCAAGPIIEITAALAGDAKIYEGGMGDVSAGVIDRFVAIGSTGDLVQGSPAAFCGVVTGLYDYANSSGGVAHAIQLVGMFGLPENVKPQKAKH